jgi:hypothetical protein
MLQVSPVSRDKAAVPAYGNVWFVDEGNKVIRENLGHNRPAFAFGASFASRDEIGNSQFKHYPIERLPETIKLPSQSPLINRVDRHWTNNKPLTHVTLVTFDLNGRGLCVEDHVLAGVDFTLPPPDLIDLIDLMPSNVYIKVEQQFVRISFSYKRDGQLLITENPAIIENGVFKPWKNAMAFFHHADAAREANRIRTKLLEAADWQSREIEFPKMTPGDSSTRKVA